MYHGQIAEALQKYTLDVFRKEDSVLRVLICTIAFGMGVEIPDVRQVIHCPAGTRRPHNVLWTLY